MRIKYILCVLAVFVALVGTAKEMVTVCQAVDKVPIAGASVISANGLILGSTDANGHIQVSKKDFPLSVRCLGYEAYSAPVFTDTINLEIAEYTLPEAVISKAERPITRVLTYVREYCTGATATDTLQLYTEYMFESFFADGKVKGYSWKDRLLHPRNVKRYARIVNANESDSVFKPSKDDDISSLSGLSEWPDVPYASVEETEAMKNGAQSDTIMGEYWPKYIYSKVNNKFIVEHDKLSYYESHSLKPWLLKMLGLTAAFTQDSYAVLYNQNPSGKYGIYDYLYSVYNFHLIAEGKWFKKMLKIKSAFELDSYMEQYPVEIERLTIPEYKALKKDKDREPEEFRAPEYVLPLAPGIQNLIDRANFKN